ncbi:MAG: MotA/TolQ/ExbB proton channel family protein, partial [Pseudobdellovibrionaceae bacterium]
PPALGMIGTVMGMVTLFSSLDQNKSQIGSHLSMAMTATFFGLIVSNLILSPLADRVHVHQVYQHRVYASIYEILLLINRNEPESIVMDEVTHRAA